MVEKFQMTSVLSYFLRRIFVTNILIERLFTRYATPKFAHNCLLRAAQAQEARMGMVRSEPSLALTARLPPGSGNSALNVRDQLGPQCTYTNHKS